MIVDRIRHNAILFPDKEAVVYGSKSITYKELVEAISQQCFTDDLFIRNNNPIDTLITLLAFNANNEKAIVVPSSFDDTNLSDIKREKDKQGFIGILSSGSTGESKVIWKTNDNWEIAFKHQSCIFGISKNDRVFVLDALSYSANLNAAVHALWVGSTLVLGKLSEAKSWSSYFEQQSITSFFLVPSHCRLLTKNSGCTNAVKSMVTAGEKLDVTTAEALIEQFPNAVLTEYYGASELGHISYHQNEDILRFPHAVGKAFPEVSIQILDEKVKVESPYVSATYKDIGTVNDLGYLEKDRLILKGRAGRVFNRRALNIYAQEIENTAVKFAHVSEAVLVQLPNKRLCLYFTTVLEDLQNEKALSRFLNESLPPAKRPNFIREIKEIPHSEAGKVDFKALSKLSEDGELVSQFV